VAHGFAENHTTGDECRRNVLDPVVAGINASNLTLLSISINGQNRNHDDCIALDVGGVPDLSRFALVALAGFILGVGMRVA
jgi:hypothetical protein